MNRVSVRTAIAALMYAMFSVYLFCAVVVRRIFALPGRSKLARLMVDAMSAAVTIIESAAWVVVVGAVRHVVSLPLCVVDVKKFV